MADDNLMSLALTIEARTARFEKALNRIEKQNRDAFGKMERDANKGLAGLERRLASADARMTNFGKGIGRQLLPSLGAISAALSVREVSRYADAWTGAKNSLAVAGIVGEQQAGVLERLFKAAQDNAAPVTALADLFGKAAQASDNLGASQQELLKFSDGVATSLRVAGTSAGAASGALTQLGQLLGQARVQAEEFNSINEGARPILIAVAHGLDEAGGSVSKLKALVNEGKVSGREFFQAFLRGLPEVQKMAANATQTIDQGLTKVNNALTKYIGETDASLGASQRLIAGLNTLADNFDQTADVVLKVAAIIAGGLVGRSLVGMIAKLGLATAAVVRFVAALRTAAAVGSVTAALTGLSAAAGPLGWIIGGTVVGALALFGTQSAEASASARTYAQALAEVEAAANKSAAAVEDAGNRYSEAQRNALTGGVEEGQAKIAEARDAVVSLFDEIIANAPRRLVSAEQLASLADLRDQLKTGETTAEKANDALYALANSNPKFQKLADQLSPLLTALANAIAATDLLSGKLSGLGGGPSFRAAENASMADYAELQKTSKAFLDEATRRNGLTKDQLALETEIAAVRKEAQKAGAFVTEGQIRVLAQSNLAADTGRKSGGGSKSPKKTADDRFGNDVQSVRDRTAALIAEREALGLSYEEQEKRQIALELEQGALEIVREAARRKGDQDWENAELTPEQVAKIDEVSEAYARQAEQLRSATEAHELQRDILNGALSDMRAALADGKLTWQELGDVAMNVLNKLIDKLQNDLVDALLSAKGGSGGGFFGGLFNIFKGLFGFSEGGKVKGEGTETSDSNLALLSDEEHVIRARQAKKYRPLLEAINNDNKPEIAKLARGIVGDMSGYSRGGAVGFSPPSFDMPSRINYRSALPEEREPQTVDIRGVFVDDDGVIKAKIDTMGQQSARAGATAAVTQVRANMPSMLAETQMRTL